jgi:hypothetical protein
MLDSVHATDGSADEDDDDSSRQRGERRDATRSAGARGGNPIADPNALAAQIDPVPKHVIDAARRAWAHRRTKTKDAPPDA